MLLTDVLADFFVFSFYVWLAFVGSVMGDGNFGEVDRKEGAKFADKLGFWLDGSNGAEADELIAVEADAGIVIFEEFFGRGKEAALLAPEILEERWNGAIMHVAGENEIEGSETLLN